MIPAFPLSSSHVPVFPAEAPDSVELRQVIPTMPCPNSWPTKIHEHNKMAVWRRQVRSSLLHSSSNWHTLYEVSIAVPNLWRIWFPERSDILFKGGKLISQLPASPNTKPVFLPPFLLLSFQSMKFFSDVSSRHCGCTDKNVKIIKMYTWIQVVCPNMKPGLIRPAYSHKSRADIFLNRTAL